MKKKKKINLARLTKAVSGDLDAQINLTKEENTEFMLWVRGARSTSKNGL